MDMRDYYRLLQIQPDASSAVIRAAYHALMLQGRHHPDLGGTDGQAAALNEAYATLRNPDLRASYDETLSTESDEDTAPSYRNQDTSPRPIIDHESRRLNCPHCGIENTITLRAMQRPRHQSMQCGLCRGVVPLNTHRDRKKVRRNVNLKVRVAPGRGSLGQPGRVMDCSDTGMRIVTLTSVPLDQSLHFFTDLFEAEGRAIWVRKRSNLLQDHFEVGIRFTSFVPLRRHALLNITA